MGQFKEFMIEDYLRTCLVEHDAEMKALHCINSFLEAVGKNVSNLCLIDFEVIVNDDDMFEIMIAEENTNIMDQYMFY